ncbi:hypothetical protein [Chitinophaga solisilvae]|uniref:hypothetical protein n=1 Tax=Chitinophaga solisilvae TaxID=1233460 RepID=UPI00136C3300|nr:hypothetical protein [Chitinophaga solisilvae]
MKYFLLMPVLLITAAAAAQKPLPVIHAGSAEAVIVEGDEDRYNWHITPAAKPDVHTTTKITAPKWIRFYTDRDSIRVKLKPGAAFDFIVLLNGKDSCYTRLESPPLQHYANMPVTRDTIPFELTAWNNIKIKAVINGKDTIYLKFDSGATGLLLTNDILQRKIQTPDILHNRLQIGNLSWDSLHVYEVVLSGQGTDGRFGWDLFDGKIVEIDYDRHIFVVHSRMPAIGKGYTKLPIEYTHYSICVQGTLEVQRKKYTSRFLFDNGYQRTIMLDTTIMREQQYPQDLEIIRKVVMKNGQGEEIPVITVNNEKLMLGALPLYNIPVQLMATANPARFKTHILGNEVLKRFNTLLDFQHHVIYLKPNSLQDLPYIEAKKSS